MSRMFYAHTCKGRPAEEWHPLLDHLRGTAERAGEFASAFESERWGYLAGLWHDLGKFSRAFQDYLRAHSEDGGNAHESELLGRVDHSTAGAQHAFRRCRLKGRLLAYCIAGHHAGLPDNVGQSSSLSMRLEKNIEPIADAPAELQQFPMPPLPTFPGIAGTRPRGFALAFFTRMLFSCLVDADFLDTEEFMSPERSALRPVARATCGQLLDRLLRHLDTKQSPPETETPVNRQRREVLAACRDKARLPPGFFSLEVPTGGGKTLSSLAFALEHAVVHDKRRVIYAIPFTSIIEQTADVFRDALGDLRDEVLEHHGSLEPDDPACQSDRTRLAAENFDATLVVTTNVQLFESLFAYRTSRCRKLHRLARSVIVLDEAQALPVALLEPTLAALKELVARYGATVVLCTATQPAIEQRETFPIGITGVRPIIDEPARLHAALRRTVVERVGPISNAELVERLRGERQALCIVNSRRHAADLYRALDAPNPDPDAFHLSASMCAAHRTDLVREIRRRLDPKVNEPCRVISTQVIEAGVDVDFPAVFRAEAGLDSIAQAAGRCNREGGLTDESGAPRPGRVLVFGYDTKAYPTVPLICRAAAHFRQVAPDHLADLLSPEAIKHYFRIHYWEQGGDDKRGWDHGLNDQSILDCFTTDPNLLHAQFRIAAEAYRLIDDEQTPVLVPYGDPGRALVRRLESLPPQPEPASLRAFDRSAQRYVVGVYDRERDRLLQNGVLLTRHGRYYLGNPQAYHERLGLNFEAIGLDADSMVI